MGRKRHIRSAESMSKQMKIDPLQSAVDTLNITTNEDVAVDVYSEMNSEVITNVI